MNHGPTDAEDPTDADGLSSADHPTAGAPTARRPAPHRAVPLGHWRLSEGEQHVQGVRRTRRRMRALARQLELTPMSTVEDLCAAVAELTGRPVRLEPRRMRVGEPSGFVERRAEADLIHVEQETSGLHRAHIVCHELAHLLCGHLAEPPHPDEEQALVELSTIDPEVLRLVLGRSHYDDAAEEEAEVLGAELMRILVLAPGAGTTSQLAPALEHRRGQHV
ncbi:hypothetical protein GCM10009665_72010 [Kitasatospora nipponensis]|uniref:IrrE N-terminal-like domain-containing protein n=1 Tax=Kitasatospora nipponensis TaxID=258049 RepID=A0ABP4HLZ9_9ACTN